MKKNQVMRLYREKARKKGFSFENGVFWGCEKENLFEKSANLGYWKISRRAQAWNGLCQNFLDVRCCTMKELKNKFDLGRMLRRILLAKMIKYDIKRKILL